MNANDPLILAFAQILSALDVAEEWIEQHRPPHSQSVKLSMLVLKELARARVAACELHRAAEQGRLNDPL